jgi:hypothetical protein
VAGGPAVTGLRWARSLHSSLAFRASITSVNTNTRRVAVGHAAAAPPLLLRRWAASVSKLVELVQIGRFEPVHDYDEP